MGYRTLMRMQLRPGVTEEQLRIHLERWRRELGPRSPGSLAELLRKEDGTADEYIVLHLFASHQAYRAMDGGALQDQ